ncbi:MAG TPA: ribosomal protein S18-alanine N-acetyltransferase [Anaerolineales bacterium]|nr:ribosomal protein S18-alanine N-acetyltransferase [Anaerolineales bacterium]
MMDITQVSERINHHMRTMCLSDVDQVVQIDRLSFTLPWSERTYRLELTENSAAHLYVAELEGQHEQPVVGYVGFWFIVDEAHISTLAVHPDFRGMGIGRRLLEEALVEALLLGADLVTLEVRASNQRPIDLYKNFGFRVKAVKPRYYRDNHEDALLMILDDLPGWRELIQEG